MGATLAGRMTFNLYGEYGWGIEYKCDVLAPETGATADLIGSRGWPLFLESQIGKIPKEGQQLVLQQVWQYCGQLARGESDPACMTERLPSQRLLASTVVDVLIGRWLYVTVNTKAYGIGVVDAVTTILMLSLPHVARTLGRDARCWLTFFVGYGLTKWARKGLPGALTVFTKTWDFQNMQGMIKEAKELGFLS